MHTTAFTPSVSSNTQTNAVAVSIIVPIYNSEHFINGLMDSVLNQSFCDFELICINDGSKDNSLELLRKWAENDKRIIIVDKPNGGVSSARNVGIERAKGEYIWFHDHDDYAFPDTLSTMYDEANGRDMLIAGWLKTENKDNIRNLIRKNIVSERITADNIDEMCHKQPFNVWIGVIWRCLFKKSVLIKNNIRFRELTHEDTLFIYEFLSKCKSCVRIDFQGYVFMDTPKSLGSSHKYNVNEEWLELASKAANACFQKFNIKKEDSFFWRLHLLYIPHCLSFVTTGYHSDSSLPFKERINRWRYLRNNKFLKEIKHNGKFKTVMLICTYKLYYFVDPLLWLFTILYDKSRSNTIKIWH